MTSRKHTPLPQGPFLTGNVDLVCGLGRDGLLMRLYYPAELPGNLKDHVKEWTPWFQGEMYTKGLSRFYFPMAPTLYEYIANWITRGIYIPSVWEAPLSNEGKLPVIVFSHGLTANRVVNSTICNDLASHGFLVAAVEHKDESACATFFLDGSRRREWMLLRLVRSGEKEYPIRNSQIQIRQREVSKTLDILELLNRNKVKNQLKSSFDLGCFEDRLDLSKAALIGHSFGGSTVTCTLAKDKRFKCGIPLDPWMFPLKNDLTKLSKDISQPMLFILMESFQDYKNLKAIKNFKKERNTILTIKGTVHQNQVDSPFLMNYLSRVLMDCNSVIDPLLAVQINDKLMINFLWKHLGQTKSYTKEYENFIVENESHIIYAPHGTAKAMLGWASE